ncbi:MAG: PP2C family protein-serine/threonine phosphatase [Chloroflexaceae bacterium]|nr:PP2C family protein-serine/threonine phosphatase [Chloroflexaceae bacterium]
MGEQVGAHIENVLLYKETLDQTRIHAEMELAQQVQRHLLPQGPPRIPTLDISAQTRPALQVGGDFYDFITVPNRRFVFGVGDVAGKGLPAALLMAMIRTSIRSKAIFMPNVTPAMLVSRSIDDLYEDFTKLGMFASAFIAQYHPEEQLLVYTNAGHAPVIYCPHDGPVQMLDATCPVIGFLPFADVGEASIPLRPNDVLILASDGFSETRIRSGELFGFDRMLEMSEQLTRQYQTAREISEGLFVAIDAFGAGTPQDDDQTLVVIRGCSIH